MSEPTSDGLVWTNITYDIPQKQRKDKKAAPADPEKADPGHTSDGSKRILRGVSGNVAQGEYVGLLGASGAGKTTLLNILSARVKKVGTIGGEITYGGVPRAPASWKRTVGYVEQDDAMLPKLTVAETIKTSARLRMPNSQFSLEDKRNRVRETIDLLRLEGVRDGRVGGANERGISGGERKRTSIAVELVSDVSLLFLDEPTSGLDAFAANLLVSNVSNIVRERNLACLMTVHQPSWAIFCKLDRVILLAQGDIYYDGPPRDTVEYFKGLGFEVPEGTNPADHFISIAENEERNEEGAKRVQGLLESWKQHTASGNSSSQTLAMNGGRNTAKEAASSESKSHWPTPWWEEFGLLYQRWFREFIRDKSIIYGTVGQTTALLIIIGFAFFRLDNSQADILPKIGVLFFIPINAAFSVLFPLITPFAVQRAIMIRERSAGLYRTSSFFLAKAVLEVPSAMLQRLIFYVVVYFMIGLRLSAGHFFIYLGINMLQLVNSVGLGLAIGAVSPTIDIANIIAPFLNVVFLLFGGSFLPSPPPWFVWLKWISPIHYTFSALIINEFSGEQLSCDGGSTQCYSTGDAVIQAYGAGSFTIAEDIGFLIAITAVFYLLGYIGLRWSGNPRLRFK